MIAELANVDDVIDACFEAWRPPPRLKLSEWADQYFYLSAESAAEPGRWKTIPYQREILDAFTDPSIEKITLKKSARVGYTKMINAAIGYAMHQAPCPVMLVQPTVEDAKGYSKEEIAPMLRDCPALAQIIFEEEEESGPRDSGNTILHKRFPGGVLSIVGANSGTGFRRVSRKWVLCDEVDAYPPSAGSDGDQLKLAARRAEYYWDRKLAYGSTPLVEGASRISQLYDEGDQRKYYVPCPECGHMAFLVFTRKADGRGHYLKWPEGKPEEAHFVCSKGECRIDHEHKRTMVAAGEWRAEKPFNRHASFHIWAAYSYAPNASWGQIAVEFLNAKSDPEKLRTFVNTVLGETWREQGEAPDWERLYNRRETYAIGTVPDGVRFLSAGVDVQKDRWVYEVVGWGDDGTSWSIDAGVIPGDPSMLEDWADVDALLNRPWINSAGQPMTILVQAVDSGAFTQDVYGWARQHPMSRVIATKGVAGARVLLGTPTPVDVTVRGKRLARGYKVWPLGGDIAKAELYGRLKMHCAPDAPFPPGWCHFPEYGQEFFKELTAEHLVTTKNKKGFRVSEWQVIPNRQNHQLDARVMARAAASLAGLDRLIAQKAIQRKAENPAPAQAVHVQDPKPVASSAPQAPPKPVQDPRPRQQGSFMSSGGAGGFRGKGWIR